MRGKSSLDFPAVLIGSPTASYPMTGLAELGYKPGADPEDLVKHFWCALVFETYFAGHPRVTIPVHLLPRRKSASSPIWSDNQNAQQRKTPVRVE